MSEHFTAPTIASSFIIGRLNEKVHKGVKYSPPQKNNPQADTSKEEAEIDRKVYELYGLSDEESEFVEKKQNSYLRLLFLRYSIFLLRKYVVQHKLSE